MASKSDLISGHLPSTRKLNSFKDVDEMLIKYHTLYLKSTNGTRAVGLIRAAKEGNTYSFQEKSAESPVSFTTKLEAANYVEQITRGRTYIIQQAVDLLMFENRYIDFRVIMQKDHTMQWQCTGIVTSLGKRGGVCSNYSEDDKYMSFEEFLGKFLSLKKKEVFQKKQELIGVCKKSLQSS